MKRLPRVGFVVSSANAADGAAALRRGLPREAWGAILAPVLPGSLTACTADGLDGSSDALVGVQCDSETLARSFLKAGALAALVHRGSPPAACLWQRGAARAVDPNPGTWRQATADELCAAALRAQGVLGRLGRPAPRFGFLASHPQDADCVRSLRAAGLDCSDPLDPHAAADVRVDAWLCATPSTLHAALAFSASGSPFAFGLEGLEVWAPDLAGLGPALTALTPLLPPPHEAPRVQVQARQAPIEDRCPFCHRPTQLDATDGLAGPPVTCAACNAPYHRDCLAEHGGCAVMGCTSVLVTRWGIELPLGELAPEQAQRIAFESGPGGGEGPLWVRVEAPIDDPRGKPSGRRIRLVLPQRVERGAWLHGFVAVESPREYAVRGGVLELRTTLLTRSEHKREQRPIVAQRAAILGSGVASALGRLSASIFGSGARILIPSGVRRYPLGLRIPASHPPTVSNRFKDVEESVQTVFRVQIGSEHAEQSVEVF